MYPSIPFPAYLSRLFYLQKMPPLESAQQEGGEILSCLAEASGQPDSLPPDIDLSPLTNPAALPRHFVDAVRRLKSFLPIGCELLGQGDLEVIGSYPIDVGGFAEIWVGRRNDGTRVAIKSHRYYSSSSCLSIYSVSNRCYLAAAYFVH